jgi:hypothetical protein
MDHLAVRACFILALSVLASAFLAGATPVAAQVNGADPAATVTQMVVKMKALRSTAPIVEFVHWDTAFQGISEAERSARGFKTPAEMREYYTLMLSDPEGFARREVALRAALVPPEQRAQVEKALESSLDQIRGASDRMREQFREIQFEVGAVKVEGDTARVTLTTRLGGTAAEGPIDLVLREGRWYLPSVVFATTR